MRMSCAMDNSASALRSRTAQRSQARWFVLREQHEGPCLLDTQARGLLQTPPLKKSGPGLSLRCSPCDLAGTAWALIDDRGERSCRERWSNRSARRFVNDFHPLRGDSVGVAIPAPRISTKDEGSVGWWSQPEGRSGAFRRPSADSAVPACLAAELV